MVAADMSTRVPSRLPPLAQSLSARLLVLTILFVMLSEVLIFAPSVGRFRLVYLEERLAAGRLAILALEATPNHMVSEELERELLAHAQAHVVGLHRPNGTKLMLSMATPEQVDETADLRQRSFFGLIGDAFATLARTDNRLVRVVGPAPLDPTTEVEVVIDEAPLHAALLDYSKRILGLSIVISLLTAALLYVSLHWLMVRPMRRITASMTAFRDDPEDMSRSLSASGGRSDEIGVAERELADMQERLRGALHQKSRQAALGVAVTKINHDLRGILSTARLVSDRIAGSDDPEVRRLTPTLLRAIDRAVDLCSQTLNFIGEKPPPLSRRRFRLAELVEEVGQSLPAVAGGTTAWASDVAAEFEIDADRDQLFRVLANLGGNAIEAGASRVEVRAAPVDGRAVIEVSDNGRGLPPGARDRLFQPFAGSGRVGGTGLGLAIARELMRAHGGDIRLVHSTGEGTLFRLELPLAQGPASRAPRPSPDAPSSDAPSPDAPSRRSGTGRPTS